MITKIVNAPRNVINLYDVTSVTPLVSIENYTDGIYDGDSSLNHSVAQKNQHNYLLDEIGAGEGFKILDVGCGLGTLLETARERDVEGVGITVSESQVVRCKEKGLDVYLLNYKNLPAEWTGQFDGIIANGSLEHFCQPEDAIAGRQNQIYRKMFKIFARLLNPKSASQRVATTAIHFRGKAISPKKFLRNPFLQIFDEEGFHTSVLHRGYGGYYPVYGQLKECADDFELVKEVDGTEDYRITSEHWTKEYSGAMFGNLKFMTALFRKFLKNPAHTFWTASSYVGFQSWAWQFRGENPPARLYRHTWQKIKEEKKWNLAN